MTRRAILIIYVVSFFVGSFFPAFALDINVNLVSRREPNTSSSIYYGDVWGETNLACLGIWKGYNTANGVWIYDVSNPSSPVLQSVYTSPTSGLNQFELGAVRNRIGYFGSWSGGGVHLVSLTNATAPVLLAQIGSAGGGFNSVHTIFLERNFLYEAAHVNGINTVKVIDVSNPFAPFFVRDIICTNAYKVHQLTAIKKGASTILYTSDFGGGPSAAPGQTDIWDVSNVGTQPALWLGKIISGASSHSSWPTPDGNTLVVCRETTGGEVKLYDISNPANPVLQTVISPATMGLEADLPHNPVIVSNLLFLSWYQNGLHIFDISDRTKPVRIGSYDTFGTARTSNFEGNWGVFPHFGLNKILASDIQSGFYILDASAILTNTNNYPPLLITNPVNVTTNHGNPVSFNTFVTGSSLKYQWRFNGNVMTNATNNTLVFNSVQSSNSGNYFLIASNNFGAVTSSVATLSVIVPAGALPTITSHPSNASVYAESPAGFSVAVTGAAPLNFQWRFNGDDIVGETNNSLTLPAVKAGQVGDYSVLVWNEYGTAMSSNAVLAIIDSPYLSDIRATTGSRSALISWKSSIPSDSQVEFSVTGTQGAGFNASSYIDRIITTNHVILLTGLSPGTRYSFQVISSTSTNSYLSGVYQFTTAGTPIILDNADSSGVTYDGAWTVGTASTNYFGTSYQFANTVSGTPTRIATFRPNLPQSGKYDISLWYPEGTNRANNAPFTISHRDGATNLLINQQINGGRWTPLAFNLPFAAGTSGFVQLANNAASSVVIADAVQFLYNPMQDFPTNDIPDWWKNFYFGANIDPLADPDGDGYSTAQEYILGTSPTDFASRLQLDLQAAGNSANITFWPFLGNRNYQLLYKTNMSATSWQVLSPGAINPTPYGHGIFTLSANNAAHGFYRLTVALTTNSGFSGSFALPKNRPASEFSEAACGVNRIYVRPK